VASTAGSRLYLEMERALARVSDCLIGVSQATVDDLVRLGVAPPSKFRVLPLGLDLDLLAGLPGELRAASRVYGCTWWPLPRQTSSSLNQPA